MKVCVRVCECVFTCVHVCECVFTCVRVNEFVCESDRKGVEIVSSSCTSKREREGGN